MKEVDMLNNKITTGKIWKGQTWEFAIDAVHNDPDCRILAKLKHKNPNNLLCDAMMFDAYYMEVDVGHKSYRTKILKELNGYLESMIRA